MMKNMLLQTGLVIIMIWSTVTCTRATESIDLQKRSTSNLEYVMSVLEEQGRLGEVDKGLLERIQLTIQQNKNQRQVKRKGKESGGLNRPATTPRQSVLNLARARQQQLFGSRRPEISEPQARFPFSEEVNSPGGECQAFKTENAILKQQLLAAQTKIQQSEEERNLHHLTINQEKPRASYSDQTNPLDKLFQEARKKEDKHSEDQFQISLSSTLITPTPTISTILDTITTITTTTVTLSKEIAIHYHGKRIPTHILETEVQVQTLTSTLSSTIEITPTPTWHTVTITPTITQPPHTHTTLDIQRSDQEDKIIRNKGQQLQTIRAEPLVAEPLLAEPLLADPLVAEPLVAEPLVALPSTSVSTMYLSGSIPGQYTTSLVTISLNNQDNENSRVKRQIKPSAHQPIMATIQVEPEDSFSEQKQGLRILSSFNEEFTFIDGKSEASEQCSDKTVTVTVTKPCLP